MFKEVVQEWNENNWVQFAWSDVGDCGPAWEPVMITQELRGVKIEHQNLFNYWNTQICGRRGKYTYKTVERTQASQNFKCALGRRPCSTDPSKPGSTYCLPVTEECPVTFLAIYERGNIPEKYLNDFMNYQVYPAF